MGSTSPRCLSFSPVIESPRGPDAGTFSASLPIGCAPGCSASNPHQVCVLIQNDFLRSDEHVRVACVALLAAMVHATRPAPVPVAAAKPKPHPILNQPWLVWLISHAVANVPHFGPTDALPELPSEREETDAACDTPLPASHVHLIALACRHCGSWMPDLLTDAVISVVACAARAAAPDVVLPFAEVLLANYEAGSAAVVEGLLRRARQGTPYLTRLVRRENGSVLVQTAVEGCSGGRTLRSLLEAARAAGIVVDDVAEACANG